MEISYQREMNHTYLLMRAEEDAKPAAFEMRMMEANRPKGLLPLSMHYVNDGVFYGYDITSSICLSDLYEKRQIDAGEMSELMTGIIDLAERLEEYLCDPSHLFLVPQYMFRRHEEGTAEVCFLPEYEKDIRKSLAEFTEWLLEHVNASDGDAVLLGYRVLQEWKKESGGFDEARKILSKEKQNADKKVHRQNTKNWPAVKPTLKEREWERENERKKESKNERTDERRDRRIQPLPVDEAMSYLPENPEDMYKDEKATVPMPLILSGIFLFIILFSVVRYRIGGTAGVIAAAVVFSAAAVFSAIYVRKKAAGEADRIRDKRKAADPFSKGWPSLSFDTEEPEKSFYSDIEEIEDFIPEFSGPSEDATCLLTEDGKNEEQKAFLLPSGRGREKIAVPRGSSWLGKKKEEADLILPDRGVSRIHARITYAGGQYFLQDLNSKNGTFVNGRGIAGEEKCPLYDGDEIAFGGGRYTFVLEG